MLWFANDLITSSGLQGATIRRDEATGVVIVARIMRGGAADRSGKFLIIQMFLKPFKLHKIHVCIYGP